jgi:hypothetical protein
MPLAEIEWGKLGELLWVAPVAAFVVGLTYSLAILGLARAGECRRAGSAGPAFGYGALGVLGLAGFLGSVAFGLIIIIG